MPILKTSYTVSPDFARWLEARRPGVARVFAARRCPLVGRRLELTAHLPGALDGPPTRYRLSFPGFRVGDDDVRANYQDFDRDVDSGDCCLVLDRHPDSCGHATRLGLEKVGVGPEFPAEVLVSSAAVLAAGARVDLVPVDVLGREGYRLSCRTRDGQSFQMDVDTLDAFGGAYAPPGGRES